MNNVVLIGRLTKDPEVRYTGDQMAIATFTLAIDRPKRKDKEKETDFIRCTAFGKTAENIERWVSKGKLIAIEGSIRTGSYTKDDGTKVYTTDVSVARTQFLEWGGQAEGEDAPTATQEGFAVVDEEDCPW